MKSACRPRQKAAWANKMVLRQHISDTAFLVAESRARRLDVSRDEHARDWVPLERRLAVATLWDEFSRDVYSHDDLELAIRNRFFLERIRHFIATHSNAVFVNVGAGLTSYPFLLEREIACFECDLPHVVRFKQQRMDELSASGILPGRHVSFLELDVFQPNGQEQLRTLLVNTLAKRPTFILLEGLSYYLSFPVLHALFDIFREGQPPGSQVGFDYWMPDLLQHEVFLRLQKFFMKRFGFSAQSYCLFDQGWIGAIEGYRILELSDAARSEGTYAGSSVLANERAILPENYALMERV
jgi:O-methyltransferase involved in polyketide biosynthesis